MSKFPHINPGDRLRDTITGSIIIPGNDDIGHHQQLAFKGRYELLARAIYVTPELEEAMYHLLSDEADFFEVNRGDYAETERYRNVVRNAIGFKDE